jgi:hypothetical protein
MSQDSTIRSWRYQRNGLTTHFACTSDLNFKAVCYYPCLNFRVERNGNWMEFEGLSSGCSLFRNHLALKPIFSWYNHKNFKLIIRCNQKNLSPLEVKNHYLNTIGLMAFFYFLFLMAFLLTAKLDGSLWLSFLVYLNWFWHISDLVCLVKYMHMILLIMGIWNHSPCRGATLDSSSPCKQNTYLCCDRVISLN